MVVARPPHPPVAVAPGRRPQASSEEQESHAAAWAMVGVLVAFKTITIVIIFLAAQPSQASVPMLVAMNWPYVIVVAVLLSAVPMGYWLRLVRARARRHRLMRAEWDVD